MLTKARYLFEDLKHKKDTYCEGDIFVIPLKNNAYAIGQIIDSF
ncbi:hypothetical protein J6TS2_38280 [Heyndrickxia sporothermodurans]|nr:hypothetical protein J6TS2_38280 [Heyndrickxia sporothermodurans]